MSNKKLLNIFRLSKYTDKAITLSAIVLLIFGTAMVLSATMGDGNASTELLIKILIKQIIFAVAGFGVMAATTKLFNVDTFHLEAEKLMYAVVVILLVPLFYSMSGGANGWIKFYLFGVQIGIQPAEFAKVLTIIVLAAFFGDIRANNAALEARVKRVGLFLLAEVFIIVVLQRDFGSALVLILITLSVLLMVSEKRLKEYWQWIFYICVVGCIGSIILISPIGSALYQAIPLLKGYQLKRFTAMFDPFSDPYNSGYHLIMSLTAIGNGGITGVGYGNSLQKYANFPNTPTDYIFSIVMEEFGLVGMLFVFFFYMIIIGRLLSYAMKFRRDRSRMILVGTSMYIFVHFFVNIGGITGLIPMTGIPLLLISAGGSSTISVMLALGLCQAVITQERKELSQKAD